MPPGPTTTPKIALQSLLGEITTKKKALAEHSDLACKHDHDDLEEVVRHCVATDALLIVAQAIVLTSLNAGSAAQS